MEGKPVSLPAQGECSVHLKQCDTQNLAALYCPSVDLQGVSLQTFPLYAVTHERLGVLGTREYALRLLKTPDVTKGYYAVVEAARRGDLFKHGTV